MTRHRLTSAAGFTLIEVLITVTIVGVLLSMSLLVLPGAIAAAKADSGSSQLSALLRTAREQAVTERRNVEVRFQAPDAIEAWREDIDANGAQIGQTLVQQVFIGERMELRRFIELPDTPDGFSAGATAVEFTGAAPWSFTSEGTLVDANGDVVNGTVFLGRPFEPLSARAVTLFGPTALLREWQWNGRAWTE
ncbi:type II secretion system protein [Luteitalea sp.]|jgi:prepilin-type N-terminal cleavage/methylation domain-containing protein|uniref:pilus assembly FimT family protein n=1 Tax=Luteitalea sp. TaxID=2004800 RepID=UPI0025BC998C|nr:type II secretion system protein [Luteitalea sp.]